MYKTYLSFNYVDYLPTPYLGLILEVPMGGFGERWAVFENLIHQHVGLLITKVFNHVFYCHGIEVVT